MEDINVKYDLHEKWYNTRGTEGKKLFIDNLDLNDYKDLKLTDRILCSSNIISCSFDNKIINNVDFYRALLASTTFRNAIVENSDYTKAVLDYADFSNANISNTKFIKSDCIETIFRNVTFKECTMSSMSLISTDLSDAKIINTNLVAAYFNETLLNGATFYNAIGINEALFNSINIGTSDNPVLLKGEEAKKWFIDNCVK